MSFRYIGDVLLSTPLALSIKEHLPDAVVDYLVFEGTEGILAKNSLIRKVYAVRPGSKNPGTFLSHRRRYDYSIGANPSDRTTIHCAGAGRVSIGFSYLRRNEWWKKWVLSECRFYDDRSHIVPLILSQLEPLAIPPRSRVVMEFDGSDEETARSIVGDEAFVLLHPYTRRGVKLWNAEGWGTLAGMIRERLGWKAMFSLSPDPADSAVTERIRSSAPPGAVFCPRPLSLPQLAALMRLSRGYVGVDTVATHMAAALDVPAVALFGPTLVHHWGPWPNGIRVDTPYSADGGVQRQGRITVLQRDWPCVPCNRETCALSETGRTECMEAIRADEVFDELAALTGPRPG